MFRNNVKIDIIEGIQVKYPSFIQLYPTLQCNQNCSFCFNQSIPPVAYRDMKAEEAYLLGDLLIKKGIPEIDILGGEPVLLPWLKDFAEYMTDSGIILNISTNGSLPGAVGQFIGLATDLFNLGFSIHGFSETHNALTKSDNFSHAMLGLGKMLAAGENPIVKSILTRENKNEIFDFILYLAKLGVKRYYLLHEDTIGRRHSPAYFSFPEFYDIYSRLKLNLKGLLDIGFVAASGFYKYGVQRSRCDAGIKKIAVLPDGSVFPCSLFAGFEEFRLGNIFEDGLERIWGNPLLQSFRNYDGKNPCKVNTCLNHSACTGGCPAHSYFFLGTLDSTDPRCNKHSGAMS